jgi:hypothetical protein
MKSRPKVILEEILHKGESAIDDFIIDREAETLFLDFKRSADNGGGKKLHQNDRTNLARAISGFGNSEGGIIVWGVDCREDEDYADVAQAKFPLIDPQRYRSWLESAVSASTIPPHSEVEHHVILSENGKEGYVITYIPKSNHAPHQVISSGKGHFHYYIRAGSNFVPTPHAVLAGMFGRRSQPHIFHMFTSQSPKVIESPNLQIESIMGIQIANGGQGIASDLFMSLKFLSKPGKNCKIAVQPLDLNNWMVWSFLEVHFTAISNANIRLPPDAQLQPYAITLILAPPFENDLRIEGLCGCGQSPSFKFTIENKSSTLGKLYNGFIAKYKSGTLPDWSEVHEEFDFWNIKEMSELSREAFT